MNSVDRKRRINKNKRELKKVKQFYINIDRVKIVSNQKKGLKVSKELIFAFIYVFIFYMLLISFHSKTSILDTEKNRKEQYRAELEERLKDINNKLISSYNINTIKDVAENKLNMKLPESYQIIYIDIPVGNNVIYEEVEENDSLFENLKKIIIG